MSHPLVTFRADAGRSIGLGHLRRCAVLAARLEKTGYRVMFVRRRCDAEGTLSEPAGFRVAWLHDDAGPSTDADHQRQDAKATAAAIGPSTSGREWVIVDHYGLDATWEHCLRETGRRIVALEDLRTRRHCADLLVSDTPLPFSADVDACAPAGRRLLGFEYTLLAPEFVMGADDSPRSARPDVLVTYGASDPSGETLKVSRALPNLLSGPSPLLGPVNIVLGPAFQDGGVIREVIAHLPGVTVHTGVTSLAPLMRGSDIIVGAGGNTLVEALALGKPCIVTITAENQRGMVEALHARQLVHLLGDSSDVDAADISAAIVELLPRLPEQTGFIRATTPFDGCGAARIAGAMQALEA